MKRPPRSERLDLLARVLRDRPGITAAELSQQLGVTERSIFRDLDHLRDRGFPIEASRGRGGGLRLHRNWGLSRVQLSAQEALCVLLSLAISERMGFPMFVGELAAARRRIVDAFPERERRTISPLRERIFIGQPASARVRQTYRRPESAPMRRLQAAFVSANVVSAEYVREDGERSRRRIEPHALVINWPAWYVIGFDHLRGESRTFRMDRFATVDVESTTFTPRPREMARELIEHPGVEIATV